MRVAPTTTQRRQTLANMRVTRDHNGYRRHQEVRLTMREAIKAHWQGWAVYLPIGWKPVDVRETR